MRRVGYFISDSRKPEDVKRKVDRLKAYKTSVEFGDYVGVNYKNRLMISTAINELEGGDRLIVEDIICLGTTIREISKNMRAIKAKLARLFVINKSPDSTYGRLNYEYVIAAHNLLLDLSRHREAHSRPGEQRKGRRAVTRRKTGKRGRPLVITEDMIHNAREWVREDTKIQDVMSRYNISRASAYRLVGMLGSVTPRDIEEMKFFD